MENTIKYLKGTLVKVQPLIGTIQENTLKGSIINNIPLTATVLIGEGSSELPAYEGNYTVTPIAYNYQELNTNNKRMIHNMVIKEIPYYTTTNLSGGYTAIIGD